MLNTAHCGIATEKSTSATTAMETMIGLSHRLWVFQPIVPNKNVVMNISHGGNNNNNNNVLALCEDEGVFQFQHGLVDVVTVWTENLLFPCSTLVSFLVSQLC